MGSVTQLVGFVDRFPRRSFQVSKLEGLTAAEEWFEKATMAGVKPNVPLGKTTGTSNDGFDEVGWVDVSFRLGLGCGGGSFLFRGGDVVVVVEKNKAGVGFFVVGKV